MGWKNIKTAYRIKHIVQIREGRIAIGSAYVSDLIRVSFEGEVSWGNLGPSRVNDELTRYYAEMTADLAKVKVLIQEPDTFERSLPVFTYDGAAILEKQCEDYGWPNVTHDGLLMYENSFSPDRAKVIAWAKRDAESGVELWKRRIGELRVEISKAEEYLAKDIADLALLTEKEGA